MTDMIHVDSGIRERILTIRGVQVMLDRDLAELYGVEVRAINQAVKRNAGRFPRRFAWKLTPEESRDMKSQSVISRLLGGTIRINDNGVDMECLDGQRGGIL